jgi:hypothetical protein
LGGCSSIAEVNTAGNVMAGYRAYILGANGRIANALNLECEDDEAAKKAALKLLDGRDVELWRGKNKIAAFEHKPK